jgi:hypothetical protein
MNSHKAVVLSMFVIFAFLYLPTPPIWGTENAIVNNLVEMMNGSIR